MEAAEGQTSLSAWELDCHALLTTASQAGMTRPFTFARSAVFTKASLVWLKLDNSVQSARAWAID
jgi:hypothetical protein